MDKEHTQDISIDSNSQSASEEQKGDTTKQAEDDLTNKLQHTDAREDALNLLDRSNSSNRSRSKKSNNSTSNKEQEELSGEDQNTPTQMQYKSPMQVQQRLHVIRERLQKAEREQQQKFEARDVHFKPQTKAMKESEVVMWRYDEALRKLERKEEQRERELHQEEEAMRRTAPGTRQHMSQATRVLAKKRHHENAKHEMELGLLELMRAGHENSKCMRLVKETIRETQQYELQGRRCQDEQVTCADLLAELEAIQQSFPSLPPPQKHPQWKQFVKEAKEFEDSVNPFLSSLQDSDETATKANVVNASGRGL